MSIGNRVYRKGLKSILSLSSTSWIDRFSDELLRIRVSIQEILRQREAREQFIVLPEIFSTKGDKLVRSILESNAPWDGIEVPRCDIPGMLTDSEKKYYCYITAFYSGWGEIVELGPWLGLSTFFVGSSLLTNSNFIDRKLYVFDDFTWRTSWMDKWLVGTDIVSPGNHASFQQIFESQLGDLMKNIIVERRKICDYDGNEDLPTLDWHGGPIELLVVDCGRSLAVNDAWWTIFSSRFVPDKTLIIMQDWQNHKRVPEVYWENTKIFTDSKGQQLDLIHEVKNAGIATFLYRGASNA
jgi:hypothetical protein